MRTANHKRSGSLYTRCTWYLASQQLVAHSNGSDGSDLGGPME